MPLQTFTSENSPELKADLHLHTSASDGTWEPISLVENILKVGISLFTVSDHDSTENVAEVARLAREHQLGFVPGVEINTHHNGHGYHILGLGIDPENQDLQRALKQNRDFLEAKDEQSIHYLSRIYPQVSVKEYHNFVHPREKGGWKALNYLIAKNLCHNDKDFFPLFEGPDNPFAGPSAFVSPPEAIRVINEAGGKAILAHPGSAFYGPDYHSVVSSLLDAGVDGLECFHPDNSAEITRYCLEVCHKRGLLATGGSDCHGDFVERRHLGYPDVRLSQLNIEGIRIL